MLIAIHVLIAVRINLQTVRNDVTITVNSLTPKSLELDVAVVGDIHAADNLHSLFLLSELIEDVISADPDLVLFVGDYTESPSAVGEMTLHRQRIIDTFQQTQPIPSVFVLGNYETWSDADLWYSEMRRHGLNVLENEVQIFETRKGSVCVRGLGDRYSGRFRYVDYPVSCDDIAKLSVTHDPSGAFHNSVKGLVFAGHTHCGQVKLPLVGVVWVPSDASDHGVCGLYEDKTRTVFVTSGVGTSILPVRYGAQSQWDFIEVQIGY